MLIEIKEQPKAEYSQKWFDYKDDVKLLIASSGKPSFNRTLELNNLQAEQELRGYREVTDETAQQSGLGFNRAVSHLLLGWTGIEVEKDKPLEYTQKNAELICTSSTESNPIVSFIVAKAFQLEKERASEVEDAVGKPLSTTNTETTSGIKKKRAKSTNA
ncbi:hypothetical protein LSO58_07130 [Acinetobacter ursingii]|uniref:Uncharacterized protein n=1 Tax=Acinetobacter ursingii TaxID=108980 RepID=A0AA46P9J6_9GAMM|nr:hypothetical protein [Acinetobacter ursingii]MCU4413258.1 hypothetical protein [Acinetobacter sp. WU_MDCI_Axc73]UYF76638.1 hypothetical protein LSO58_07130 [Acinetobacter ursingii]